MLIVPGFAAKGEKSRVIVHVSNTKASEIEYASETNGNKRG